MQVMDGQQRHLPHENEDFMGESEERWSTRVTVTHPTVVRVAATWKGDVYSKVKPSHQALVQTAHVTIH